MRYGFLFAALCGSSAAAQPALKVSEDAWRGLSTDERTVIQQKFVVEMVGSDNFGLIIDNQGADRSTPGTNGGAVLGGAVASATYIDKSIGNGNYSAKNHLGVMLLGGLLGSMLDSKPQSQYQFRYSIRLGSGSVVTRDVFSSEPFRHPVGVCITLPDVSLAAEQNLCTQTAESLRAAHIGSKNVLSDASAQQLMPSFTAVDGSAAGGAGSVVLKETVNCKVGALAPVRTSPDKCNVVNGVILND